MWLGTVILCIAASVLVHAVLTRLSPKPNAVFLFLAGGVPIGMALCASAIVVYGLAAIEFASAILIYAAFCELYLFLFTLALSSISANILVRLLGGPRVQLELNEFYNNAAMVEARLARMQSAGLLRREGAGLQITPRGALVVRSYRFLRTLFRHDRQLSRHAL